MTRAQIMAGMAIMEAAVGGSYDESQFEVWRKLLSDIDPNHYLAACQRAAIEQELPVLPTLGRIRALAIEALNGPPIAVEAAYAAMRDAIARFGFYEHQKAKAAIGEQLWSVIRGLGGWRSVCDAREENLFPQFRDAWQRSTKQSQTMARLPASLRPEPPAPRIGYSEGESP